MNKIASCVGEENYNTFGTLMRIIECIDSSNIVVEFQDEFKFRKKIQYCNFKTGSIKNPYDKTVFGRGYIGDGEYVGWVNGKHTDEYDIWKGIIKRCYSESQKDVFNSYFNISEVCDEWLNFQNFAAWYNANKYKCDGRLHIDKDIKYAGNKIYSPHHCLLVPQRINMLFLNKPNNRGLPNGTWLCKKGYIAKYNGKELGTYPTLEEAYAIYSEFKKRAIIAVANEYKDKIPEEVYIALLNYEVCIENDKNYVA